MSGALSRREFQAALLGGAVGLTGCAAPRAVRRVIAVDCHAHVFRRDLPMPDQRRAPTGYDATPEQYLNMLDENGMSHGVLVQPSFLGTDNSYLVAALRKYPERLRGIAVVEPTANSAQLQLLQDAGVVGIRLNLIGLPAPNFTSAAWQELLAQLRKRDWQVEVHQVARELKLAVEPLLASGLNVVIDHFGRPDERAGVEDPGFQYLLSLGTTRKIWVKVSGAYRNGADGRGDAIATQALPLLRSTFGLDRLAWGSDWPHTLFERTVNFPTVRRALDLWLPSEDERRIVLHETAARLFRFNA